MAVAGCSTHEFGLAVDFNSGMITSTVPTLNTTAGYVPNNGTVFYPTTITLPNVDINDGNVVCPWYGSPQPIQPFNAGLRPMPMTPLIDYERLSMQQELMQLREKLRDHEEKEQAITISKEDKKRIVRLED